MKIAFRLLGWIPLWIQYGMVDLLFFPLVYHIIRYRRGTVRQNLTESFPAMSRRELKLTERRFYRHLCDMAVETIHLAGMSEREARRRIRFHNTGLIDSLIKERGNVIVYLSHYGNWEWLTTYPAIMRPDYQMMSVYRKLKSGKTTADMLWLRERFGFRYAEKQDTLRVIISQLRRGERCVWGMIADQHPSRANQHYWTRLLNHDTAILTGTEVIARKLDWPVAYMHISRTRRGHYDMRFELICRHTSDCPQWSITEQYARMLEQDIMAAPAYWLWTHNRWKHKRPAEGALTHNTPNPPAT